MSCSFTVASASVGAADSAAGAASSSGSGGCLQPARRDECCARGAAVPRAAVAEGASRARASEAVWTGDGTRSTGGGPCHDQGSREAEELDERVGVAVLENLDA
jgi:hypothetical protein